MMTMPPVLLDGLIVTLRAIAVSLSLFSAVVAFNAIRLHRGLVAARSIFVIVISQAIIVAAASDVGMLFDLVDRAGAEGSSEFSWWGAPFVIVARALTLWAYMRLSILDSRHPLGSAPPPDPS